MKPENGAIVMTDSETGKPYARFLSQFELNLVLAQLQALDGGTLNAREIAPFVMRTTGISQAQAERIAQKQAGLHTVAREGVEALVDGLIGKQVSVPVSRVTGRQRYSGGVQQIPKAQPAKACDHEWIASEGRTASGVLCRKCGDYNGPKGGDNGH